MRRLVPIPDWAVPGGDTRYDNEVTRNVACKVCGTAQASTFKACIACCPHDELDMVHDFDDGIQGQCRACRKNFGFDLEGDYKAVRLRKRETSNETA